MTDNHLSILEPRARLGRLANKGCLDFCDSMGKREAKLGLHELLDVGAVADIRRLLNLGNANDLDECIRLPWETVYEINLHECSGSEHGDWQPY